MRPDPDDLDNYARVAARLSGLSIDDAWWPSVRGHLATLLEHAAGLEAFEVEGADVPAPVFHP